jgi:hypothetical protein
MGLKQNCCQTCEYWGESRDWENKNHLPNEFGICNKLKIHEGEMFDAPDGENLPEENTDIIVCTSEWFQVLGFHKTFGCIYHVEKGE